MTAAGSSHTMLVCSIAKMLFFVYILPCSITYVHFHQRLLTLYPQATDLLVTVGGVYGRAGTVYQKLLRSSDTDDVLAASNALLLRKVATTNAKAASHFIAADSSRIDPRYSGPCLFHGPNALFCGTTLTGQYTNAGKEREEDENMHSITVSSYSSSSGSRIKNKFLNLVMMLIPATSLLIALNCGLAYMYWNLRIAPTAVAKQYKSMVQPPFEIWRSLTGSTAHFELWHLGLNMMSLSALGQELEGLRLYSSVGFLFANLSLVSIVSALWLLLQYGTERYWNFQDQRPTVGYSGVLFAWMVIASLEQSQTCPIIFMPDLCFPTYSFGPLRFSLGPIVQLVVMQVLLPRVSMTGHLAGILAGFALHWGLVPTIQPAVILPLLYLAYLLLIRKVEREHHQQTSMVKLVLTALYMCVLFQSIFVLGPLNRLTVSFACSLAFWLWNTFTQTESDAFATGYIVSAVLTLITDAMSLGGWLVFASWSGSSLSVMLSRAFVQFATIIIVFAGLQNRQVGGIFEFSLSYSILQPCKAILTYPLLSPLLVSSPDIEHGIDEEGNTFVGTGRILGSGSNGSPGRSREISRLLRGSAG
jgi:membrane associated rhomboid family serine protease